MSPEQEIGRELKVSELKPGTVVVLEKGTCSHLTSVWVEEVTPRLVMFDMPVINLHFIAFRTGPDMEQITDDTGASFKIYEFLGEV